MSPVAKLTASASRLGSVIGRRGRRAGPAAEEAQLDQEGEAGDHAAEPLDEPGRGGRGAAGGQHVVDDRATRSPGCDARRGGSRAGRCRTRARTPRDSMSPRQLARPCGPGRSRRRAGRPPARPRMKPRASMPEHPVDRAASRHGGRRGRRRRSGTRPASASSGVMSLKTIPGFGKSGMSRMSAAQVGDRSGQRRFPFFRGRGGWLAE